MDEPPFINKIPICVMIKVIKACSAKGGVESMPREPNCAGCAGCF